MYFAGRVSKELESDYFQQRTASEPAQASLVHAINNSLGLPLLTSDDMFAARSELEEAAGEMDLSLYLGTDAQGTGDWPIEVAQHAVYKKLALDNLTFKSVNFGLRADGTMPKTPHGIINHANDHDFIVELQFPVDEASATAAAAVDAENPNIGLVGYDWKSLPVGKNGERGHFVAVRNKLVYDSAVPAVEGQKAAGIDMTKYPYFAYTKKVHWVTVVSLRFDADSKEQETQEQAQGQEGEDEQGEDEREGESDDEEVRQNEENHTAEAAEGK